MQGALLLDIVVCHCSLILKLLACKDKPLLIRRDALLVLNLRLYIRDRVTRLDLECDRLARQSLYKDLHFTTIQEFVFSKRVLGEGDFRFTPRV